MALLKRGRGGNGNQLQIAAQGRYLFGGAGDSPKFCLSNRNRRARSQTKDRPKAVFQI
jgi:hypothetical protein